ncbi:MAG: murein peptide amidase A [Zetaproteobacteria bacterium]|nr:MAG: murein peptide amidase A [Zetaproteobacteria bacterium]
MNGVVAIRPGTTRSGRALLSLAALLLPLCAQGGAYTIPARDSAERQCHRIGHKLGSVSIRECLRAGLVDSGARSANGQAILIRRFPPPAGRRPKARVLLIGGIHGDEFSSVSIVFKWMRIIKRHHTGLFHWHIIPLANPDGLLRRHSRRVNGHGVDLNRNFPTRGWSEQSRRYWIRRTHRDPRRYPGPAAASEPETRALMEEIARFQPDVIISVHAPYGILDFDGPPDAPRRFGYLHSRLLGTYPGSLGNYAGVERHIPVVTMELPYAGIMPPPREIHRMWRDMVRWIRRNIPRADTLRFRARQHDRPAGRTPRVQSRTDMATVRPTA